MSFLTCLMLGTSVAEIFAKMPCLLPVSATVLSMIATSVDGVPASDWIAASMSPDERLDWYWTLIFGYFASNGLITAFQYWFCQMSA